MIGFTIAIAVTLIVVFVVSSNQNQRTSHSKQEYEKPPTTFGNHIKTHNYPGFGLETFAILDTLQEEYRHKFPTDEDLFTACAVISTGAHIIQNTIDPDDVVSAYKHASSGSIRAGLIEKTHIDQREFLMGNKENIVDNFLMQMDVLITQGMYKNVTDQVNINTVLERKNAYKGTSEMMKSNKSRYENQYAKARRNIEAVLYNQNAGELRKLFSMT